MLFTDRCKYLFVAGAVTAVMSGAAAQAASCADTQNKQTSCVSSEHNVSWTFATDSSADKPADGLPQLSFGTVTDFGSDVNIVAPLILASASVSEDAESQTATGQVPVSIEQSLSAGLGLSNTLASSRQAFIVSRQSRGAATSANDLTGTLSLSGSDIRTDAKTTAGGFVSDESRVGSLTIKKRVYDFGESETRLRAAELDIDAARARYQLAEQNVVFEIISAHLAVLTARKAYAIREANVTRLEAHTEAARIRLDAGTSTPTRLAEAEARLARAQSDKIQAEAALQTAVEAYQSLTGLNAQQVNGFDGPAVLPQTMAEAEQLAGEAHPSVRAALLAEKSSGLQFQILKQTTLPKVNLSLSATQTDRNGIAMDKDEVTTQLQLTTPFLVTEGTRSAARSRLASHTRAKLDAAESRRVARLAARQAFRDYKAAVAQLAAVDSELVAAKLVSEGTATEVEFGLKTFLDQLDAEQDLSDVELRHIQAQQAVVLNGYDVLRSTGQLSVSLFALSEVPPSLDSISDPSSRYPYILPIAVE